jgi:hypothetical protein
MNNVTILLKVKERLNKLSSNDYDNIESWQIVEAFCKGSVDWSRRQLHGTNVKQTGDEQSKRRIDDLRILLQEVPVPLTKKDLYFVTNGLPDDYMEWKRVSVKAMNDCCEGKRKMVVYLAEEGNVDELLRDVNKKPSYEWGETFCTLKGTSLRIYTNDDFDLVDARLSYYKQPRRIQIIGVVDPYTNLPSTVEVISEFKDDIVELLIDEAVKILAGDIESINQMQISDNSVESNN